MQPIPETPPPEPPPEPPLIWWLVMHRVTRYVVAWLVALGVAILLLDDSYRTFDLAERAEAHAGTPQVDLNESLFWRIYDSFFHQDLYEASWGPATIDFGGQWLMGRMLVENHGDQLYNRTIQRRVLARYYSDPLRNPVVPKASDLENLMGWLMGHDQPEPGEDLETFRPVGGPLYPPINAFIAYPLALMQPWVAYRVAQFLNLAEAVLAGLGIAWLTRRRIWWPVATTLILLFPGFSGSLCLGQNATLTLVIVVWGWALVVHERAIAAGVVWGLLAFKPVWGLAFFLPLLLTWRWRTGLAMIATGAGLAAATLPVVGIHSWLDWLYIGRKAAELYKIDENWLHYSRDVLSIPRRWLEDFRWDGAPEFDSDPFAWIFYQLSRLLPNASAYPEYWPADVTSWAALLTVILATAALALWRRRQARATTGTAPAFLLLGAWLSCYHFMYYDVLLASVPLFLLCADPIVYLRPHVFSLSVVPISATKGGDELLTYFRPEPPQSYPPLPNGLAGGFRQVLVLSSVTLTLILVLYLTYPVIKNKWVNPAYPFGQPWDTYVLIVIWLWCGALWIRQGRDGKAAVE